MNDINRFDFQPVTVGGVRFRNPFYVASGPTTRNLQQLQKAQECGWAGASIKLVIDPAPYINREPRYGWFARQNIFSFTAEKRLTPDMGLQLVEDARKNISDFVILANITYAGEKGIADGWGALARRFEEAGAHAIELNMCCPNMSFNVELSGEQHGDGPRTGASLGQNAEAVSTITRVVKECVSIPVFVKLTPEGGGLARVAKACIDAGADAVGGTANRLAIPPFDIYNPQQAPYHLQDELSLSCFSGAWTKPLGLRDVYEMRKLMGRESVITGVGGIRTFRDVVEMTMMGANLFGICTETILSGYGFLEPLIQELRQYLVDTNHSTLDEIRGSLVAHVKSAKDLTLFPGHAQVRDPELSAPCVAACPNSVPAQGYTMAVARRDFRRAYELVTSAGPFQSVCGYVCHHPCESVCVRGDQDEPIRIRELKKFILDYGKDRNWTPSITPEAGMDIPVAVMGSGPAGLSAAYYLAIAGYRVTVFEAREQAGGMLRDAIPRFRLPLNVVDDEIDMIRRCGVEIETGVRFPNGICLKDLRNKGFRAVVIAVGAQKSVIPSIPGTSADGCFSALSFLQNVSANGEGGIGQRVAVIGGGFTAVDTARTCLRLGAKEVYILYRRTKDEMPATPEEVFEAEEEGVRIMYLVSPKEILAENGAVTGIRMVNHVLGARDNSNRRTPEEVEGTEFTLSVDTVLLALGQSVESAVSADGLELTPRGSLKHDSATGATSQPDVFVAGDAATGADTIIAAVAGGRKAAIAVDRALSGDEAKLKTMPQLNAVEPDAVLQRTGYSGKTPGMPVAVRPPEERAKDFQEYAATLTEEEAVREAERCLNCGCGEGCMVCRDICNSFAIREDNLSPVIEGDNCVGCGVCVWRCPNKNIEMIRVDV
jgi:NADPH-dependent glutamate synthase beta subunit-like oxidoreductase/dihydroorotate dehydrogenase